MVPNLSFEKIYYGGDYNPDQWSEDIWIEDMRLFRLASITMVTLPVFSWAKLQPSEEQFDFNWLDRIMDLLAENSIDVCMATPTAAQPAWMSRKYPDILPVDENGRKRNHGKRVNFCPNSPSYRRFALGITEKMVERYANHPALKIWHIANEYGTYCYCDQCATAFRRWLKVRYGSVENLNKRWNLSFWGHIVYDWEDVNVPSELNDDNKWYQPKMLDYLRFITDSTIECFRAERMIIRKVTPGIPITTNMSGFIKKLDQVRMNAEMDIAGWDNYPWPTDSIDKVALKHDIVRGLKDGQSFLLMEQSPNQQNWQPYNVLKRPGEVRLLSYQALAHGADTVMFFQLRQSIGGVEKMHGALISHAGHEKTRIFKECAQLGHELKEMGNALVGARTESETAILFDWDNWWALEMSSGPHKDLDYFDQVNKYYKSLHLQNIGVDLVRPDGDLSKYKLVVAPSLYMVKQGVALKLESYVKEGGYLIVSFFSGIVDENDLVVTGGYPGGLRNILGIWVEETDGLSPDRKNRIVLSAGRKGLKKDYDCGMICDILHLETARAMGVYGKDFYKDTPCITQNDFGKGKAYYIATDGEQAFLNDFLSLICEGLQIRSPFKVPSGVELAGRIKNDHEYLFVLNHNTAQIQTDPIPQDYEYFAGQRSALQGGRLILEAYDTVILIRKI